MVGLCKHTGSSVTLIIFLGFIVGIDRNAAAAADYDDDDGGDDDDIPPLFMLEWWNVYH